MVKQAVSFQVGLLSFVHYGIIVLLQFDDPSGNLNTWVLHPAKMTEIGGQ